MKKFINLCKKPFLIASTSVFVLFFIALIVLVCLPRGNSYSYERDMTVASIKMKMTFKGDKVTMDTYTNSLGEESNQTETGDYRIEKGNLYSVEDGKVVKVGDINAFKITINTDELMDIMIGADAEITAEEAVQLKAYMRLIYGKEIVLVCGLTTALRTTSIVLMSVSGAVAVACLVLLILDKKGIIKYKEDKPVVEVDEVSGNTVEAVVETTKD